VKKTCENSQNYFLPNAEIWTVVSDHSLRRIGWTSSKQIEMQKFTKWGRFTNKNPLPLSFKHSHPPIMTTYQALANIIRGAYTRAELDTAEERCTRHYNNGTITAKELARLDSIACEKFHEILLANEKQ